MNEQRYRLDVYWSEAFTPNGDLQLHAGSTHTRALPVAVPFEGTWDECNARAAEIVASTAPLQQRFVPTLGLYPTLRVEFHPVRP